MSCKTSLIHVFESRRLCRILWSELEAEVVLGVIETDLAHHLTDEVDVVWQNSTLQIAAEEIAQDAPKVFVSWIREKTTAIGQHPDEASENAEMRKGVYLPLHRFFLIEEPPTAAELHLARESSVLEVAEHRREGVVIRRVEVVEDDLWEFIRRIESIKIALNRFHADAFTDGIEAGIRPESFELAAAVVAQRPEVELLSPTAFCRPATKVFKQVTREFELIDRPGSLSIDDTMKDTCCFAS